jgi:hypothetical protein
MPWVCTVEAEVVRAGAADDEEIVVEAGAHFDSGGRAEAGLVGREARMCRVGAVERSDEIVGAAADVGSVSGDGESEVCALPA